MLLILAPACQSTDGGSPDAGRGESGERAEPAKPPASTRGVSGRPIRLEWRNLNPRHGAQNMGLINRTSPDLALLYRTPDDFKNVKPVEDEVMANMLSAVRESDFFALATKGVTADRYKMGDGHGVVWVQIGDESWTLLFSPATAASDSDLPRTYRDTKVLILNVWSSTLWFSTSTSGGDRSLKIEPHKYKKPE